ncbi:hypothetical protein F0Q53_00325 [Anaplasma marginale]|uniref:Uncharacterized protein n=2 Tax=Anaplasma marginale TaxID=770 RepID=B9KIB6_ANAMF|nr:hypothetical protein [Anaplasma marginale]AAV86522.1 hypothetical protein AM489 [Anaplasma marginale str. St. Maries]ACM49228.1 Hypothetical protein AMF_1042 [Anaplasma marginale str. Florida]AXW83973.1 hypothetical protein CQZ76_01855 [Anaplasma marginale]AXW84890.1 hypothetical protein BKM88_01840 [Anaplasma marginale]KAA8473150.1 hypothetical protein F0Q58_00635 [Anaplasma marginale]
MIGSEACGGAKTSLSGGRTFGALGVMSIPNRIRRILSSLGVKIDSTFVVISHRPASTVVRWPTPDARKSRVAS